MSGRTCLEPGPGRGPDVVAGDPAVIFALGDHAFAVASDFASHALQGSAMPRWALPVGFGREAHGLSDAPASFSYRGFACGPYVGWSRKNGWLRRLSPRRAAGRSSESHPAGDGRSAGARPSVLRAKLHPCVARVCCIQDTKLLAFRICDAADGSRVVRISPLNRLKRGSSNDPSADSGGIPGPELAE
jgi:hypothetical protein